MGHVALAQRCSLVLSHMLSVDLLKSLVNRSTFFAATESNRHDVVCAPNAIIRFLSAVPFTVLSELLVWLASLVHNSCQTGLSISVISKCDVCGCKIDMIVIYWRDGLFTLVCL